MGIASVAGAMGAGSAATSAIGWIEANIIGGSGWLQNYFDPKIITAPSMKNDGSAASYVVGRYKFIAQPMAPSDKDMKAMDDFFEAFGYRVDTFAVPNLALRSTFTYVKTRDAVVKCDNRHAATQMAAMLNNGCKFWKGDIG